LPKCNVRGGKAVIQEPFDWQPTTLMQFYAYLRADESTNAIYAGKKVTEVEIGEGVRGRYLAALLCYYGKSSLERKKELI
jgi:hypothetical protein